MSKAFQHLSPDDSKEYEQLLDWISSIYVELNNQPKVLGIHEIGRSSQ